MKNKSQPKLQNKFENTSLHKAMRYCKQTGIMNKPTLKKVKFIKEITQRKPMMQECHALTHDCT